MIANITEVSQLRSVLLIFLCSTTWAVSLMHVTAQPPPEVKPLGAEHVPTSSMFLDKAQHGVHHLVLYGPPYVRGRAEGMLTRPIMHREEQRLFAEFERFFPNPVVRYGLVLGMMRYFWGAETFFPEHMRAYFYGLAPSASKEFNHYIDPYTRQAVLHGIHEVGQMSVDMRQEDFGCTAFVAPAQDSWIVGRNFDFAVDRLFDEEKTLKWQFPDTGHAFLSVSWPGFLGTVTGVNEHGLYISLNAAGTKDYRRYGLPTTLVATEILQRATSVDEAIDQLTKAQTFITDIYLLVDKEKAVQVEKSPLRTRVIGITGPHAAANHLTHADFENDPINQWRKFQLTSQTRLKRAEELLTTWKNNPDVTSRMRAISMQAMLRDKRDVGGEPLHLANRRAIDSLIASHSVIYDAKASYFFVSTGPALVGKYAGYDLQASFRAGTPVRIPPLPADPELDPATFAKIDSGIKRIAKADKLIKSDQCDEAQTLLMAISPALAKHNYFQTVLGKYHACKDNLTQAKDHWRQALRLKPAYRRDREFLEKRL